MNFGNRSKFAEVTKQWRNFLWINRTAFNSMWPSRAGTSFAVNSSVD